MTAEEDQTCANEEPIEWLRQQYQQRRQRNSAYSLRAFARHLQVSAGELSQILSRKRRLTKQRLRGICERLELEPEDINVLLERLEEESPAAPKRQFASKKHYELMEMDQFHLIADWLHFALLSLMETSDFKGDNRWIADRLGVTVVEISSAWDRLQRLGLVEEMDGRFVKQVADTRTTHGVAHAAIRLFHRRCLERMANMLDDIDLQHRDITQITFACNPKMLSEARQRITAFRRSLAEFLEDGEKSEVYSLAIQLVPLSKSR